MNENENEKQRPEQGTARDRIRSREIESHVRELLYDKYIAPTRPKRERWIGMEVELPVCNLDRKAVDFDIVHALTGHFMEKFGFAAQGIDDEGNVNAAKDPLTGDILSFDCSYNNLELSFGREKDLNILHARFLRYYRWIQEELSAHHYTLSGIGINPYRIYNHNVPIPNGRYRMLFHHLHSYPRYNRLMYFHPYPAFGTFTSASQVQLDVDYEELPQVIRAFEKVEPVKARLFSNSVLLGEHEELLCARDMFWENSTHGINPHNIGMYDVEPRWPEDILDYISTTSIYCTERDGKYINFEPVRICEYFKKESVRGEYYGDDGSYHQIEFVPRDSDIAYLRTFKFQDLTFRGTIEFRSCCCQPIHDVMTVAAFHVGLKEKAQELEALLDADHVLYHHEYTAQELRKLLVMRKLPDFVDPDGLRWLERRVLDLAAQGLRERGLGEEKYLDPLYGRIEEGSAADTAPVPGGKEVRPGGSPAEHMLRELEAGIPIEEIIKEYAAE